MVGTEQPAGSIPVSAGIGLRGPHLRQVAEENPSIGWLEVHSENYFGEGGAPLSYLEKIRALYPLSLHGVGLSLGTTDPLNQGHLARLKALIVRFEPGLVSEHLSWGAIDGVYVNDLLPMPYTEESLTHFCERVSQTQDYLGRQILIENPSSYLCYQHSTIPEWEFYSAIAEHTGCGLLLDVNNIYVSACNHGFDAQRFLAAVPARRVQEIHLAGFSVNRYEAGNILIDDHGSRVKDAVWTLYNNALDRLGPIPTLIEWDSNIPALEVLLDEASQAQSLLDGEHARVA